MNRRIQHDRWLVAAASYAALGQALLLASAAAGPVAQEAPEERILRKQVEVSASVVDVWQAWTTPEGIASFFAPRAELDLKIGGKYELYINPDQPEGQRGGEGCTILTYEPHSVLAFTWNAPPSISTLRDAEQRTFVVLTFDPESNGTVIVRLRQLGWGEGEDWDRCYAYFDRAWSAVLANLKKQLERDHAGQSPIKVQRSSWVDGMVNVTTVYGAHKRQEFEIVLPVPLDRVWRMLATTEGLAELFHAEARIELVPGGVYSDWPGVEHKVLAYAPMEMLSGTGSAPPKFPSVRAGGTWWIMRFEAFGSDLTRLRMSLMGWREDDQEWVDAFDYFLTANPVFLHMVYTKLTGAAVSHDSGKALVHEGIIGAPVAAVWSAFTTKGGLEAWMVPHAEIDLRVGGKMRTNYHADGKLGDENTIENTILSFEPQRMLSLKATKPPAGFPFKRALPGMWSVMYFEPLGPTRTRVRVVGMGYGDDEDSKAMRAFFDRGNQWTIDRLEAYLNTAHANQESGEARSGEDKQE